MPSRSPHPTDAAIRLETVINWLALLALLALGIVWPPADAASPPPARHAGTLLLKAGPEAAPLEALRHSTSMHAVVTGNVARVAVTQTFSNPTADWVEGLYVFPLPVSAAVDELEMRIGTQTVRGEIRRRAEAQAAYREARAEGRQASLLDQERPNMFTAAVANIAPGGSVTVQIAYLDSIPYRDGRYTLNLPLAITPRYTPGVASDDSFAPSAEAAPGGSLPASWAPEQVSSEAQKVAIEVDLAPGFALNTLESLHHPVSETQSASGPRIRLASSEAPADRDFELVWTPQLAPDTQATAFAERRGNDSYVLLMLTPPQMTTRQSGPREVIFIIDTSGSMYGPSIEQARAALQSGVARLGPGDRFNVIRFSDEATELFQQPRAASVENRLAARAFIDSLRASGGTEMRTALELAFATPPPADALRQIVFMTDGSVGNETELVKMIHDRIGSGRLFTVGIGAAPNTFFMHAAAAAGRGSYTFIGNRDQVQERMTDLFAKLEQPALIDLELRWPGDVSAELAAPLPGDVYAGDPLVIAARLPEAPRGLLTLSGVSEGHAWVRQVPISSVAEQSGIAKLWARERIAALTQQRGCGADPQATETQIVELALAHHLVSDFTSLVAVDTTPVRPLEAAYSRLQAPTSAPAGSYWAASTGFARTATPAPLLLLVALGALGLAGLLGPWAPGARSRRRSRGGE
jgi:Ca-activated chloride channel family protein